MPLVIDAPRQRPLAKRAAAEAGPDRISAEEPEVDHFDGGLRFR